MVQKLVIMGVLAFIVFVSTSFAGEVSLFSNVKSLAIVLGGTLLGVLVAFPVSTVKELGGTVRHMFTAKPVGMNATVRQIVSLARVGRLKGIKALEQEAAKIGNPFLKFGVELVVDRYERYEIRDVLEREHEFHASRLESQLAVLNTMSKLAPAFGFVGTIIGLVGALGNLSSAAEVGKAMSVALLTTFYGLLLANVLFLPISRKLSEHIRTELAVKGLLIEGITAIAEGENSRGIQHRLKYFLEQQSGGDFSRKGSNHGVMDRAKFMNLRRENA